MSCKVVTLIDISTVTGGKKTTTNAVLVGGILVVYLPHLKNHGVRQLG